MRKETLVFPKAPTAIAALCLLAAVPAAFGQSSSTATLGQVISLPGQVNEIAVDEARGLVYVGNFSAGRVEVVSMDTKQRIASFPTSPQQTATSGMAVSPNGQWLVTTNLPTTSGVTQLSSVTVVNLNDPSERRSHSSLEQPLAVAFGADNKAVIITVQSLQLFDPADGSFEELFRYDEQVGTVGLPVQPPSLPGEITNASAASSGDGNVIFGITSDFIFSYRIRTPRGLLTIRSTETLVNEPAFGQVSASHNGDYFMAGQMLFSDDLRVIADTPEAPDSLEFVGGTGIDSEIDTVYGAFGQIVPDASATSAHPIYGVLQVMDSDNLYVRQRWRLTERIRGRIVPGGNGRFLYAVSDSGLLYLPLVDLEDTPVLEVHPDDRNLMYAFDFCNRNPITLPMRIESPNGAPATFRLSAEPFRSSDRPGVIFEPATGVTPAVVQVTVDPGALGPVQGTNATVVNIETDAANIPQQVLAISNIRDVDQVGQFMQIPGHIVSVQGDPARDRFYALDQRNFRVLAYDANDMRQIGSFKTGNTPTWMTTTRDGQFLVVANSRGENVTVINLVTMQNLGPLFMPWQILNAGHYPTSVTTDHANVIIAARSSNGGSQIDTLNLPSKAVSTRETLGIFANRFGESTAVAGNPDGTAVLIADDDGQTALWESASSRVIVARDDFGALRGGIGAGPNYYMVDNQALNSSLVPLGEFPDDIAAQESAGFAVLPDGTGVRSVRPVSQVDTGAVQQIDPRNPARAINSVRMAEPPPAPSPDYPFMQSLGSLRDGRLVSASSAGVVMFRQNYQQGVGNPRIGEVTNGADFARATAVGGLISIFGNGLAPQEQGAVDTPLPTRLASTCVSANGAPLPLMYVSPNQINAQMTFTTFGPINLQVHSNGGVSDVFVKQVDPAAPAIFGVRGPDSARYAAVFRENNTLSTLSNPLRPNEIAVVYLTGLGETSPLSVAGVPASSTILAEAAEMPTVTLGGVPLEIRYGGLTPGFVGLYQLNLFIPSFVPKGLEVPLTITSGANSTTVNVRVVE